MLIVLSFAVLVLAIGMLVLFAMMGELAARVPQGGGPERSTVIDPLETERIGHAPEHWPPGLSHLKQGDGCLLVLSSSCTSCQDVAMQVTRNPGHLEWQEMAVLVSAFDARAGKEFVSRHGLGPVPHYVDERGSWVMGEFSIRQSPVALTFSGGQLMAAYSFHDVAALRAAISETRQAAARQPERTGL